MLTDAEIRAAADRHFSAEQTGDIEAILATVTDDVEYVLKAPRFADGGPEHQVTSSVSGVRQMWADLYASFWPYRIEVDELVPSPTEDRALVFVTVTATPKAEWEGLPAGRPVTWSIAAICDFAADGRLRRETIYAGNVPIVLWSVRRMRDAARQADTAAAH